MAETLLLDKRTQSIVEGYVPEGELLFSLVRFYSIFADGTRIRLLSALAISEMCVTDLSRVLGINQTTAAGAAENGRAFQDILIAARARFARGRHFPAEKFLQSS